MNILYLINFAGKAGTEKYVEEMIDEYNGKKANCFFCYNIAGPLSEKMREKNIPSFQLSMKSIFDISAAVKLAAYCRENKIDIIASQYPRENILAIISKLFYKKPGVVFTSHLVSSYNLIWRIINKIFTRYNKKIIAVCNYGKKLLSECGYPENKIEVIYNGINLPSKKSSSLREELGLADEFIIFTMARYNPVKGLNFLLQSIYELKKLTNRPFRLVIAGDGEEREQFFKKAEELSLTDNIIGLGYRTDSANLLSGSDIYVNSSVSEALSFGILEGISHGLPAVVSKVGGNTDIVNEETDLGFAIPYGDSKAFANAIYKLMSDKDLYNRMSKNAIKAANDIFSREIMMKKTFEIYCGN